MELTSEAIFEYHQGGKVGMCATKPLSSQEELSLAYTPGVAEPVRAIAENREALFDYTAKSNLVAVVSDGSAILGLGDLGAEASIPVMEGKGVLFKAFGDVDGWPVPLNGCREGGANEGPTDPQRVIDMVAALAPMYGGVNLEDIAAPACFEIEDKLDAMLDIPVFHDDQWGTAVITLAGVLNYTRLCERSMSELRIVINGAGAAGIRIAEMLKAAGAQDVVLCDSRGTVRTARTDLNIKKQEHAADTAALTVSEAMQGAHVFIGVSVADCLTEADIRQLADYPAIFAMANPVPEIRPEVVAAVMGDKPYVMCTGRSDYPNQVNNVLGFPFLFRGALDARASSITLSMKVAAADALAALARESVPENVQTIYAAEGELSFSNSYVIPKPFDRRLFIEIPFAVATAAVADGVASPGFAIDGYRAVLEARNAVR
ncbi:MAG: malate dehydrogenase [Verrucomicrobia bacterium]|jgi:malate dehydrogenase (oxaloacetate-decarboxylating)(NADP+)|nr:malate dehydrogenase [Verrucomicrobiota bacterium]MBT7067562.1 malate dehydrogenase [Verrucomicrobiota bacterium]MBT7698719.1 malate dehydrogenase [Verrucomicrobiota bacterium]